MREHPMYDKMLKILSQENPLQRFFQPLIRPAGGERINGWLPSTIAHTIFQLGLLTVIASIATPLYHQTTMRRMGSCADLGLILPSLRLGSRSCWNSSSRSSQMGFCLLRMRWYGVSRILVFIGGLSRLTQSLKALRVLKLIALAEKMCSTFESLILSGITHILDVAMLTMLYVIPYAVWGLNIFSGLTKSCNDGGASGRSDCVNEYEANVVTNPTSDPAFTYPVPHVWANPSPSTTFSFDSFRASLILFEIVSFKGWIDVMGSVVILTLFVSIIESFSVMMGTALLTHWQPQRGWVDLQKLIKRQWPSKRPRTRPALAFRACCFDCAVYKHGWWARMMALCASSSPPHCSVMRR
ncbi:hypothetical protein BC826DRAFT_444698 [Russula brevipes]|nr:hypothetical protein BC826DRAFT_444698 [Russula brevipes]